MHMTTLILTDNFYGRELACELQIRYGSIAIFQSPKGPLPNVPRLNVKERASEIVDQYDLVISIHCKQLFPPSLVRSVRCVNVHPGFNPYNRGWYPQVFSIINGKKAGVTIHEIDEELDHGPIIVQEECPVEAWDTSGSVYARLMKLERDMVLQHFAAIRDGSYKAEAPSEEGNLNLRRHFDDLCQLDMGERASFEEFLNRLRALTHDEFRNAWFFDRSGRKVFVRVVLEPDETE